MNWFTGIQKNTLLKIQLNNQEIFKAYFIECNNEIATCKLPDGRIKRILQNRIVDLEEIGEENIQKLSTNFDKLSNKNDLANSHNNLNVPLSFLNNIENSILEPIPSINKEIFSRLKNRSKTIYQRVINIYNNQYSNAKKINELDLKYNRVQKILLSLDEILENEYYEEVDLFLANVIKEAGISYFQYFKREPYDLYCLKHDIFYCNQKSIKFGFLLSEALFSNYGVSEKTIQEWYFFIKNSINYYSFKILEKIKNNIDKELLENSVNYILEKLQIKQNFNNLEEKIEFLVNLTPSKDYEKLKNELNNLKSIKNNKTSTLGFSSLGESLMQIVSPGINEEDEKLLKPFGEIKTFFIDRGYGFIKDKRGSSIYFTLNDISDERLKKELLSTNKINRKLKVCYAIDFNYKGEVAKALQKPTKIKDILEQIKKLEEKNKLQDAYYLTQQILKGYPNHIKAKMLALKFKTELEQFDYKKSNLVMTYGNYRKAKDAKDKKDFDTAIKYFKLALENNEKLESTIKDLALTYYEIGDIVASKELLFKWEDKLSKTISTYNFLENHYFAVGEYERAIKYINILLNIINNKNREVLLLGKKASCYIKLNNKEKAEKTLNEILAIQPENSYANKLLEELKSGGTIENIEVASFGGGLSKFIEDTLNEYEEYFGLRTKTKEKKKFNKNTLLEIRELMETVGRARPVERAKYLLTEAKLMLDLEPDREYNLRMVLAKYCNAMALNHILQNSPLDTIRFFYLESFALDTKWERMARQLWLYLLTFNKNISEINLILTETNLELEQIYKELPIVLDNLLSKNNIKFLNNLLNQFIFNKEIAKQIIKLINELHNVKNYQVINDFLLKNKISSIDIDTVWNGILNQRKMEYREWVSKIRSLHSIDNIELLSTQIETVLNDLNKEWLCDLDKERLTTIKDRIVTDLESYLKQKTFDDRERVKNYLLTKINNMLEEIAKYPTKLSYEYYKPLLEFVERLIRQSFQNILSVSEPKIQVTILNEPVIEKDEINVQLEITNEANSAPASKIVLNINKSEGVSPIQKEVPIYELLRGGHKKIQTISLKVSKEAIKNKVADLHISLTYENSAKNGEQYSREIKLPIRLYSMEEFKKIDNPYASVAEGGPVKDTKMFFGRQEYINNIIESLLSSENSKSIIIYGQKRSGKSTVLFHLKKILIEKENAFCIDFSMGDIIDDLQNGSAGFYYKILSKIEEELENLEFNGEIVPEFKKPSFDELLKSPTIIFDEKIKNFYKSTKKLDNWKNKKLIILIDEFTYIYSAIMKKQISDNFMKTWKALLEKNIFSAVLVGQDITPKFKSKFPNEFGVTEDKRLTYLSRIDAKKLIEKPIWDKDRNHSRYVGNAVDKIIQYTACNPYYLQMFCARMVDYMNEKKAIKVTEADVETVFQTFLEGNMSLQEDKFDNLLTAGDADINSFNINHVKNILYQIAKESEFSGYCDKNKIIFDNRTLLENILEDLLKRDVLYKKEQKYKIKVELFEKWLLKNM